MSHTSRTSTATNGANSLDSLRPYYFTSFQNYCCGPKANSNSTKTTTTTTASNKDLLPIPDVFKREAENLITLFNGILVEDWRKVANYTSVIPEKFFEQNDQFKVQKYLIDQAMSRTLKDAYIINWISDFKSLHPIRTSGNGNCLLHAVLIAMIGIHDFTLLLRDQLAQFMIDNEQILKTHWRTEKLKTDKNYGISSEDANLDEEWKELCASVHYENSDDGQAETHLQFLEAVHIFSVSNMFRRPIIILSEDVIRNKVGEAISVNDLFGIYLPILSTPAECVKQPIILAYDRSHFCPLQTSDVNSERTWKNLLPLYLCADHIHDQILLPIRFLGEDMSTERTESLLNDYLKIVKTNLTMGSKSSPIEIKCAELGGKRLLDKEDFLLLYYDYVVDFFKIQKPRAIEEERNREIQRKLEERASQDRRSLSAVRTETPPTRLLYTNSITNNGLQRDANARISLSDPLNYRNHSQESYSPSNDSAHMESPRLPSRPPPVTRVNQPESPLDSLYYDTAKQRSLLNKSENINNVNPDDKWTNTAQVKLQGTDSSSSRDQRLRTAVNIPINFERPNPPPDDMNLTIYEPVRKRLEKCLICDQYFDDVKLRRFCPRCDYRIENTPVHEVSPRQPIIRPRSTNIYLPAYDNGFSSPISPAPKTRPQEKIICPNCKNPNIRHSSTSKSDYRCSACQNPISLPDHY